MAACNAGPMLRETIDNAINALKYSGCLWEIIVVDDASEDKSTEIIANYPTNKVILIKLYNRSGESFTKGMACKAASGELVITSDPHCYFSRQFFRNAIRIYDKFPDVVQIPSVLLEMRRGKITRVNGGVLEITSKGIQVERRMLPSKYPAFIGSVYIFPRLVLDTIGGIPHSPGYMGGTEQFLTALCHRLGVQVKVNRRLRATHRYSRKRHAFPYSMPIYSVEHVGIYYHLVCFPKTFELFWKPIIDKSLFGQEKSIDWIGIMSNWMDYKRISHLLSAKSVMSEHDFLRDVVSCKKNPDYEQTRQQAIAYLEQTTDSVQSTNSTKNVAR